MFIRETKTGKAIFNCNDFNDRGVDRFGFVKRFECKGHHSRIDNVNQLKSLIREGQYSFPGGYAVIPFTSDGGVICVDCIRENFVNCVWSIRHEVDDGWRIVGIDTYYGVEDNGIVLCDNCGKDWEAI